MTLATGAPTIRRRSLAVSPRAVVAVILYALLYAGAIVVLVRDPAFQTGEPLLLLLVFGVLLAAAAWLATRGIEPPRLPVRRPARETGALTLYLAVFAVVVLGWLLGAVREWVAAGRLQEVAILLVKLVTIVALPALLFRGLGYSWSELAPVRRLDRRHWRAFLVMAALLLALQVVAGQGAKRVAALPEPGWVIALCAPLALVWMIVEAGLTEEFLFRVLLQTRAGAWLRSETAGVLLMTVLFAVAHAPGLVMRGAHTMEGMSRPPDVLTAVAYTIAVISPIGITFGVLWSRTRSLLLVALLHGWGDLLPNLAPFVTTWLGHR